MDIKGNGVVILGGFLSSDFIYREMRRTVMEYTGRPVWVVNARMIDWLLSMHQTGWAMLLDKLARTVQCAVESTAGKKVTIIGHSIGGVMARLYLSEENFKGRNYNGKEIVDHLITLGSPHYNQGGFRRGGVLSRWVEGHLPGAFFAPSVQYTSVAGKWMHGNRPGTGLETWVYDQYRQIGGDGSTWGDGLIPLKSALLQGSHQIVLEDVCHYSILSQTWYGSREIVPLWCEIE
jgi:pimeloyl-ACP methyl ester carboxylesterase